MPGRLVVKDPNKPSFISEVVALLIEMLVVRTELFPEAGKESFEAQRSIPTKASGSETSSSMTVPDIPGIGQTVCPRSLPAIRSTELIQLARLSTKLPNDSQHNGAPAGKLGRSVCGQTKVSDAGQLRGDGVQSRGPSSSPASSLAKSRGGRQGTTSNS